MLVHSTGGLIQNVLSTSANYSISGLQELVHSTSGLIKCTKYKY